MLLAMEMQDTADIESLRYRLALESMVGSQGGILEIFGRLVPKTSELLSSLSAPLVEFTAPNRETTKLDDKLHREVSAKAKQFTFATFQDMLVMVPEGFQGNFGAYLSYLQKAQNELLKSASEVMDGYLNELSIFLNNVDARKSMKSYELFYREIKLRRNKFEKELSVYFKKNDSRSRVKLGSIIQRFSDLEDVFHKAEQLKLNENTKELQKLLSQVNHATDLLRLLKEKIDTNEIEIVSGEMAKHISEGAYEAAKYIELVSISNFNTEVAVTCVKSLAEQLKKAFG